MVGFIFDFYRITGTDKVTGGMISLLKAIMCPGLRTMKGVELFYFISFIRRSG